MKITVFNNNDKPHTICKLNGTKLNILPHGFVSFITNSDNEINYWRKGEMLQRYGLSVAFDDMLWGDDISSMDSCVSDVTEVEEEQPITNIQNPGYTEEHLMTMDKEDLFNICKNFNIPYKRNNSVKTLVKLILEKAG